MSYITPTMQKYLKQFITVQRFSTIPFCIVGFCSFVYLVQQHPFHAFAAVVAASISYYLWIFGYSLYLQKKLYPDNLEGFTEDTEAAHAYYTQSEMSKKIETKFSEISSHGKIIGKFCEIDIYDWVDVKGEVYLFDSTSTDIKYVKSRADKIVYISPGIIYKK